jgi:hypothetical protein
MANLEFPFFKANYIDYLGRLRWLRVDFHIGRDGKLYFRCTVDEQDSFSIRLGEDGYWHERATGPTVLADELGSIIESKLF